MDENSFLPDGLIAVTEEFGVAATGPKTLFPDIMFHPYSPLFLEENIARLDFGENLKKLAGNTRDFAYPIGSISDPICSRFFTSQRCKE